MNRPLRIILITGGQRSGKSEIAERMALESSANPVYVATCKPLDEEMIRRVDVHKARREGCGWTTVEALTLAEVGSVAGKTVLIDSATMLASNAFFACGENESEALAAAVADFDKFVALASDATIIIVSDEIGLGGVSGNVMTRRFTDLQGLFNRHIAELSTDVFFIVSGIPVKIK
ncbi:MAG: bifunctional adenosylcobinamide kinase/adenosylcobinamide-phosphate guanylyltransferase [Bacteroides sp.]|nr:bifunctional adenosylcobinamide kinase/adenosylcobinamide-phosphate guanylyltransferase [Bacteroides sp.]